MRDTLYDGRPFRRLNVIDRQPRGAAHRVRHVDSSQPAWSVMKQLIEVYGKPEALRLETARNSRPTPSFDWAMENAVKLMFIQPGKPNQNAFVERLNRSFREEVLELPRSRGQLRI